MEQINYKIIYILGCGHSGSTLLDLILGNHKAAISLGEMNNYDQVVRGNKVCNCGELVDSCEFWSSITKKYTGQNTKKDLSSDIRAQAKTGIKKFFHLFVSYILIKLPFKVSKNLVFTLAPHLKNEAKNALKLFDCIHEESGKKYLIDSSKSPIRMLMFYFLIPDDIKVLFLSRDGRAVCASTTRRPDAPNLSMSQQVAKWKTANEYSYAGLRYLGQDSFLHVTYESLCRNTSKTLEQISNFINFETPLSENDVRGSVEAHTFAGNPMRFKGHFKLKEDVKWRERLDKNALDIFEKEGGELNRKLMGKYYTE